MEEEPIDETDESDSLSIPDYGVSDEERSHIEMDYALNTTMKLVCHHRDTVFGKTRCPQHIRYSKNRGPIKAYDDVLMKFSRKVKKTDLNSLQENKKLAKVVVDDSISNMKSNLMDRLKERKLRKMINPKKEVSPAPASSIGEFGPITLASPDGEDDSFDYVNVDGTMDESQADLLRLTQALGTSLPQKTSVQTDRLRSKMSTVNPGL